MKSLHLQKPHLIVVVGIPGSGKTFFAEQFSNTFNTPYIDYNAIQTTTDTPLSEEDTAKIAGRFFNELIRTKQTMIIEGPGGTREERLALVRHAHQHGYEPLFVWVQTEQNNAANRAVNGIRGGTNRLISREEFEAGVRYFEPLHTTERPVVVSGRHTFATQVKVVLTRLTKATDSSRHSTPSAPPRPNGSRITIR